MMTNDQRSGGYEHQAPQQHPTTGSTWPAGGQPPVGGAAQYGSAPYGPAQYGPPPKKKHTLRNVILVIIGLMILAMAGCTALVVGGIGKAANDMEEADNAPGGAKNPLTITAGQPFEVNDFAYAAGWTVGPDGIGGTTVKNLKVTNNRADQDAALVQIKFMKGSEVLGSADCTTDQIQVGQTVTLNCVGTPGSTTGYDRITINDTF